MTIKKLTVAEIILKYAIKTNRHDMQVVAMIKEEYPYMDCLDCQLLKLIHNARIHHANEEFQSGRLGWD